MHMYPLNRVIYMPLSSSTTFLGPLPANHSSFPTISLYNPPILNNPLNLYPSLKFEPSNHRFKRLRDDLPDIQQKKRAKFSSTISNQEHSSTLSKNALMLLHELKPSIEYKLLAQTGPSHRPIFTMAVEINGQIFKGMAQTKKEAKQAAAEKALRSFSELPNPRMISINGESHEIRKDSIPLHLPNQLQAENELIENDRLPYSRRNFADCIAICIKEKFHQLIQNDIRLQRRKVLCGVVLTRHHSLQSMEIICIATGMKCVHREYRTVNGQSLNDCHAEITARRCLIRYCYEQLKLVLDGKLDESIFERMEETDRFRIKSSIDFHLYISTAPCGDSRLFSLPESSANLNQDSKYSLRKSRGLLRTKTEVSEGTIPILAKNLYHNIETWDNERLSTMSCSDKLCRWNFIGLQGALLSTLIDPIYYTSMIIGGLYHNEHIQRALYSRIEERMNNIPSSYGLRRPVIFGVSNPEMRNITRASNHAFIWNCVDQKNEIIDSLNGLTISREASTVSKAALFQQWINLMNRMKSEVIPVKYSDAKQLAVDYQRAKMEVKKAFEYNGFGLWITKSHEQDEFLASQTHDFIPSID